jgi:hypothetical protein
MAVSIFDDKSKKPDEKTLKNSSADTWAVWQTIDEHLHEEYGDISSEWKHYGKKSGWVLKVVRKKRTVFYLIPQKGHFDLSFVFGD